MQGVSLPFQSAKLNAGLGQCSNPFYIEGIVADHIEVPFYMKLKLYEVDHDYIQYLKQFDNHVPEMSYTTNNKFVCGVVLMIDSYQYFAPISSFHTPQRTNLIIKDKSRSISSIRFSFMFPAFDEVLRMKDFSLEAPSYRNLLRSELKFCNQHLSDIHKKANEVYKIGSNRKHPLAYLCCDFKLLESKHDEYIQIQIEKETAVAMEDTENEGENHNV